MTGSNTTMHPKPLSTLLIMLAATAASMMVMAASALADFLPHQADYDIRLKAVRESQLVTDVDGRLAFSWADACDGWTINYRMYLRVQFGERGVSDLGWSYTSWESNDGDLLRFFLRRFRNGEETEQRRGEARMTPEEGGSVLFRLPEETRVDLPADTLFVKAHTSEIIRSARAGDQGVFSHLFDGTGEDDGLHVVNAVVLGEAAAEEAPIESPLLKDVASWDVMLAYFSPRGTKDGVPDSEQRMQLFENGVIARMDIDYGDFVVEARLDDLERLDPPDC